MLVDANIKWRDLPKEHKYYSQGNVRVALSRLVVALFINNEYAEANISLFIWVMMILFFEKAQQVIE